MAIMNIYLFQCGDRLQTSESDVYRRHILTSKVGPHAEGVILEINQFSFVGYH